MSERTVWNQALILEYYVRERYMEVIYPYLFVHGCSSNVASLDPLHQLTHERFSLHFPLVVQRLAFLVTCPLSVGRAHLCQTLFLERV